MARSISTSRKSTGGRGPRRSNYHPPRSVVTADHEGNEIVHAWGPCPFSDNPDDLPPFPFPLYVTSGASGLFLGKAFAEQFAVLIQESGRVSDGDDDCRFELYTKKQPTIFHCVEHARRENLHRQEYRIWPSSVERWCVSRRNQESHHQGFLLVIDRDNWQEEGIIFVSYDPQHHNLGEAWQYWSSQEGDISLLQATLHRDMSVIGGRFGHLWAPWYSAEGSTLQEVLRERNNELLLLAPNVTPELKARFEKGEMELHDVIQDEEESSNHSDDGPLHDQEDVESNGGNDDDNSLLQNEEEEEEEDLEPRFESTFIESELWDRSQHDDLCLKTYYDVAGSQVTSVWRKQHGTTRPPFSVTLYVAKECPPFAPSGLFHCLNKGLLDAAAWTLDVVYDISDLQTAFCRHSKESSLRENTANNSRRATMRMILVKVVGQVFPMELLERVEELLVAPDLPDYSGLPERPHRNMFMFLPDGRSNHGPLLVYSNPASDEWDKVPVQSFPNERRPRHGCMGYEVWLQSLLKVTDLRYWHRVANEIHIIWCRAAPRATLDTPIPVLHIALNAPTTITALENRIDHTLVNVEVKLEASFPVTMHKFPLFNLNFFHSGLALVDLTTGITLPQTLRSYLQVIDSSWDHSKQLGFMRDDTPPQSNETRYFLTLKPGAMSVPGNSYGILGTIVSHQLDSYHSAGLLRDGHEYALRQCRQDIVVPRWTWGHWHERQGPYNMPPMPVVLEREWRFKFECGWDGSQGSFRLCQCHLGK